MNKVNISEATIRALIHHANRLGCSYIVKTMVNHKYVTWKKSKNGKEHESTFYIYKDMNSKQYHDIMHRVDVLDLTIYG